MKDDWLPSQEAPGPASLYGLLAQWAAFTLASAVYAMGAAMVGTAWPVAGTAAMLGYVLVLGAWSGVLWTDAERLAEKGRWRL